MKFSIIGTGNMAWFLGTRLRGAGHDCAGIYGRQEHRAATLANALGCSVYTGLDSVPDTHELCIIAVSDDAVAQVAASLSFKQTVLLHTAGSVPLNVLDTATADNGIIWPVYSITRDELPTHRSIPCVWEASNKKTEDILFEVADAITDMLFYADSEQRKWLHLSAVIGNNFTNHLMAICEQVCKQQHLPFAILQPILHQTFERAMHASPTAKQTGPAIRNDHITMATHHQLLASNTYWAEVYGALSASIENMYRDMHEEKGMKD